MAKGEKTVAKRTRTKARQVAVRKPRAGAKPELLRASNLAKQEWLVHGLSTRRGGVSNAYGKSALNLGFTEHDSRENVEENRRRFLIALTGGARATGTLVSPKQVHGDHIHHITAAPKSQLTGDGAVTNVPGIILSIQTADCLPVLVADPARKAIGAFHAGW